VRPSDRPNDSVATQSSSADAIGQTSLKSSWIKRTALPMHTHVQETRLFLAACVVV